MGRDRGFANCPAIRPIFTTGTAAAYVRTSAIWSSVSILARTASAADPENVSAQSPPWSTNASPARNRGQPLRELVALARKDEGRLFRQFRGDISNARGVRPFRLLGRRKSAPGIEVDGVAGSRVQD